eukprot:IDg20591t1
MARPRRCHVKSCPAVLPPRELPAARVLVLARRAENDGVHAAVAAVPMSLRCLRHREGGMRGGQRAPPTAATDDCGRGLAAPGAPPAVAVRPSGAMLPRGTFDPNWRWVVEALAMGDISVDSNELSLAPRVVHASAQARAAHENYHPIHWDDDIFAGARAGAIRLPTYAIPGSSAEGPMETPACAVPASRDHPGQPLVTASTDDCVTAALVNAVFAVRGEVAARRVKSLAEGNCSSALRPLARS